MGTGQRGNCGANQFECDSGDCIAYQWLCNTIKNCPDGSDESICSCNVDEFECANGRYVGSF